MLNQISFGINSTIKHQTDKEVVSTKNKFPFQ